MKSCDNLFLEGKEVIEIEKSVNDALHELQEEIDEKQKQMNLIKNIDWNKPVSEEIWHEICETPLRSSDLLGVMVKNIFPDSENIKVKCNYVYFDMYGFKCGIPTSKNNGLYIETDWYKKDRGEPKVIYPHNHLNMKKYFNAKDNKENWDILFRCRMSRLSIYRKWIRRILWFGYYKWKNDYRNDWEQIFKKDEISFEKRVEKYYEERKLIHHKSMDMINILIPELKKFSDEIKEFNSFSYRIKDIITWENL